MWSYLFVHLFIPRVNYAHHAKVLECHIKCQWFSVQQMMDMYMQCASLQVVLIRSLK